MDDRSTWKQIGNTLTVSLIEILVGGFLLLLLAFVVGLAALSSDVYVQQYFNSLQGNFSGFSENYELVSQEINANEYVASASVFGVWAIIGLLTYYLLYVLLKSEQNFLEFLRRVTPESRFQKLVLEEALAHVTIRVAGLILLLVFTNIFVSHLLPFVIVSLNITIDQITMPAIYNLIVSGAILFGSLHFYVILLRCIMLRQRLFFGEEMS